MSVHVENLVKNYGKYPALKNISLVIPTGELVALIGPSGSGKTTLLRILAGLEIANYGRVIFNEEDVTHKSPRERRIGLVFQHYALFRNMSVYNNVSFGLRILPLKDRPNSETIREKTLSLIKLVQLDGLENRFPSQLSGGQRQRVALARALATNPEVLLLDEPFGALDAQVRKELRTWLKELHHRLRVTSIFVTHDQEEALEIADRIFVLQNGEIQQTGSPSEVYNYPRNPFVARFLGNVNILQGSIQHGRIIIDQQMLLQTSTNTDGPILVYVRPHDIEILAGTIPNTQGDLIAIIQEISMVGGILRVHLQTSSGQSLYSEVLPLAAHTLNLEKGHRVTLRLHKIHTFASNH